MHAMHDMMLRGDCSERGHQQDGVLCLLFIQMKYGNTLQFPCTHGCHLNTWVALLLIAVELTRLALRSSHTNDSGKFQLLAQAPMQMLGMWAIRAAVPSCQRRTVQDVLHEHSACLCCYNAIVKHSAAGFFVKVSGIAIKYGSKEMHRVRPYR
jgi:hypothetical protein